MTNDNRETYSTLGFTTLLILNRLKNDRALREFAKEQHEDAERDTQTDRTDEQKKQSQVDYVERRLAELTKWEKTISGKK